MTATVRSSSLPIAVAALITIGIGCLSLLRFPDGDVPEILLFLGRFHPVMVHAPIGLLVGLVLVEGTHLLRRGVDLRPASGVLLWMTAISSVAAALLGSLLALEGGYDETTLFRHRWLAVGVSLALVWALALRRRRVLYGMLLMCALVMMGCTGHFGGSLTHGSDYLTRYMPAGLRALLGIAPREAAAPGSVYASQVQPVFDRYCIKCHGTTRQKGDLRLDSYSALMASDVVVPGDPQGSLMVQMMRLPLDDLDRMPPEDKPQPSPEDVAAIEAWIAAGAAGPP